MAIKVLAYADSNPSTGFGRVAYEILSHLHRSGEFEVTLMGIGYHKGDDTPHPFPVHPAGSYKDPLGIERIDGAVRKYAPDVLWLLNDIWNLNAYLAMRQTQVPTVVYFPVDTPNIKFNYALCLGAASEAAVYTQFGAREAAASLREAVDVLLQGGLPLDEPHRSLSLEVPDRKLLHCRFDRLERYQNPAGYAVIPHGLDSRTWEVRDRATVRALLDLPEDAFVVGSVNTNQFRKRQDLTLRAFAKLARANPRAVLILHCAGSQMGGWDLPQDVRRLGLESRVLLLHQLYPRLTEDQLCTLYNALDVHINTSGGEGWGLCLGPSTLIHTPERVLPITRIRPGDRVLSSDGTFRRVRATTHRTVTDWLDVDVAGHPTTQVTPEHPFLAIQDASLGNAKTRKAAYTPAWVPVGQLKPGDYVAVGQLGTASSMPATVDLATVLPEGWEHDADAVWHPMGFAPDASCTSITELMAACGETKKVVEKALGVVKGRREPGTSERVAAVVAHVRDNGLAVLEARRYPRHVPLTDELLEVLGWYLAEGSTYDACAAVEWSLNGLTEHAVAERIATVVQQHFGVPATIRVRDGVQAGSRLEVQVSAAPVAHFFAALGGRGAHAKQLHAAIPLTDARILAVWRGLFRGDGHVADNGTTALGIASGALCAQVQLSLRALGIISTYRVHERPTGQVVHKLLLSRSQASRFWETGYAARQADTLPAYGGHRWARVRAVQPRTGTLQVYDLSIEDTHSFVGNNLIVHNTSMESAACGVPQLVPDWSATRELWKDHGILLPVSDYRLEPRLLNTAHAIVDVEAAGDILIRLGNDPDERRRLSARSLEWATQQWPWGRVAEEFARLLKRAVGEGPPEARTFQDVLKAREGVIESELRGVISLTAPEEAAWHDAA
jgi:glycosyltransferase involved in cell wall biosynthesis